MSTASTLELKPRPQSPHSLPDQPLTVIQPSKTWNFFNVRELWPYRELLYFLAWRDLKVRYKQTLLGIAWVVMQPLLMTLIFTIVLGRLARVPTGELPYPLVVYVGLLFWNFFSSAVSSSSFSLVGNANLITKVYFPRALIPAAAVVGRLVDFAVSFAILVGLMLYYRVSVHANIAVSWNLAVLPFLIVLMTMLAFGFGMLVSALNVKYRDVGQALPVLIQLWMFVSPVIYPLSLVPEKWRRFYALNPVVGVIDAFRVSFFGGKFDLFALGVSVVATCVLLIFSAQLFTRVEKSFADVI